MALNQVVQEQVLLANAAIFTQILKKILKFLVVK